MHDRSSAADEKNTPATITPSVNSSRSEDADEKNTPTITLSVKPVFSKMIELGNPPTNYPLFDLLKAYENKDSGACLELLHQGVDVRLPVILDHWAEEMYGGAQYNGTQMVDTTCLPVWISAIAKLRLENSSLPFASMYAFQMQTNRLLPKELQERNPEYLTFTEVREIYEGALKNHPSRSSHDQKHNEMGLAGLSKLDIDYGIGIALHQLLKRRTLLSLSLDFYYDFGETLLKLMFLISEKSGGKILNFRYIEHSADLYEVNGISPVNDPDNPPTHRSIASYLLELDDLYSFHPLFSFLLEKQWLDPNHTPHQITDHPLKESPLFILNGIYFLNKVLNPYSDKYFKELIDLFIKHGAFPIDLKACALKAKSAGAAECIPLLEAKRTQYMQGLYQNLFNLTRVMPFIDKLLANSVTDIIASFIFTALTPKVCQQIRERKFIVAEPSHDQKEIESFLQSHQFALTPNSPRMATTVVATVTAESQDQLSPRRSHS